jgi:PAS domain S-box-containing protein
MGAERQKAKGSMMQLPSILIVDDDAGHCANLEDILELEGYTTVTAGSVATAHEQFEDHQPGILLLDLKLPDGTGTGLLAELKKKNPDCYGVIITAHADLDSAVAALDEGAYYYLRKPFRVDELLGLLKRIFEAMRLREQKQQAERALRHIQEKLAGIINAVADVMLMIDEDGAVTWTNEMGRRIFGPELEGHSYSDVIYRKDSPPENCIVQKCLADGSQNDMEIVITDIDGRKRDFWFTANVALKDRWGRPRHVVMVGRNTTEIKSLQAEAARNAHLASLGELAAGVAHEINNPINGIINYAEILVDQCTETGEIKGIPQRIIKEGDRIALIVRKLLSFAREGNDERVPAGLPAILQDALDLNRAMLGKDNIQLKLEIRGPLPHCQVNAQQIQQVFLNIISNARYALTRKYPQADPDKVLTISMEPVELEGQPHVRTAFTDRGDGIPASILDKICNPFFSTKPADKGTGLGLSISHSIVENHGGRMWFESVEGEFTKVAIDLTVCSPEVV